MKMVSHCRWLRSSWACWPAPAPCPSTGRRRSSWPRAATSWAPSRRNCLWTSGPGGRAGVFFHYLFFWINNNIIIFNLTFFFHFNQTYFFIYFNQNLMVRIVLVELWLLDQVGETFVDFSYFFFWINDNIIIIFNWTLFWFYLNQTLTFFNVIRYLLLKWTR